MAVLAEVGRYPLQAFAAQMLLKYRNRLVGMDADRLTKRAFVVSTALAGRTPQRSRHMPWAGQAAAAIESLGLQCDLSAPASVDVKQAAVSLQSSYLASVADSPSTKVQQYLRMREDVTPDTYSMALICGRSADGGSASGWRSFGRARTGWVWSQGAVGRRGCRATSEFASGAAAAKWMMRGT